MLYNISIQTSSFKLDLKATYNIFITQRNPSSEIRPTRPPSNQQFPPIPTDKLNIIKHPTQSTERVFMLIRPFPIWSVSITHINHDDARILHDPGTESVFAS
jgi:hypothetical protein